VAELLISLNHQINTVLLILAVMETKTVHWWQWRVPSELSKNVLVLFRSHFSPPKEELKLPTDGNEEALNSILAISSRAIGECDVL
jgi:hypothetical protein